MLFGDRVVSVVPGIRSQAWEEAPGAQFPSSPSDVAGKVRPVDLDPPVH